MVGDAYKPDNGGSTGDIMYVEDTIKEQDSKDSSDDEVKTTFKEHQLSLSYICKRCPGAACKHNLSNNKEHDSWGSREDAALEDATMANGTDSSATMESTREQIKIKEIKVN